MKRLRMMFIAVLFLAFIFGCGAMKVSPVETSFTKGVEMVEDKDIGKVYLAPDFNFKGYDILLITELSTASVLPQKGIDPEEMRIYFKNQLIKRLGETGVFKTVTDDNSVLSSKQASTTKILIMEGIFTELDPGNQALRYFVGFGAGAAKVQIETVVKDPQNKQAYFMVSDRRAAAMGAFGGNSKAFILDSLSKIAEAHASFIKRIASGGKIEAP